MNNQELIYKLAELHDAIMEGGDIEVMANECLPAAQKQLKDLEGAAVSASTSGQYPN